ATRGAESGGAEFERAEPGGAEPGRVEPEGTVSGGAEPARAESGGALGVPPRREPLSPQQLREWYSRRCRGAAGAGAAGSSAGAGGAAGAGAAGAARGTARAAGGAEPVRAESGGALGVPSRREPLSPQQLREWYSRRCRGAAGAAGGAAGAGAAGGAAGTGGAAGAGAAGGVAGAGDAGGAAGSGAAGGAAGAGATGGAAGAGAAGGAAGARAAGGAAGPGAAGGAAGIGDPGAEGTGSVSAISGGTARPWPYYVPLLQQVLGSLPSPGPPPPFLGPLPPESRPVSPESRSVSPVRPVRAGRVSRPRPPPVPGTHSMTLRPSTTPQRVPLPSPPASSLLAGPDPASDSLRAASPAVTRILATVVTDPLFESTTASSLVTELVAFAAAYRLDYATSLVAESASMSVCPPSVGGECALGTDVLEDRHEEFECFAAFVPHLVSMLIALEGDPDAPDIPTPRSYAEAIEGTYVDEVSPPGANIVSGMWIFRVKRPPGSPPVFKARYVARGFSQRQGVDFFHTFSPTPKMTTLRVLLHVAAQRDYELHSLDFNTACLQGSLHEEIWLRRPPGFTRSFPAGTQWSLQQPDNGLRQAPYEWHDTLRTTLAALGFAPSTSDPSLFLRTDTTLPPFYVLVYVDDLVFATADSEALAHVNSELQKRHTCTDLGPSALRLHVLLASRARVVLTGHADASWVDDLATQRSSQGYTFSVGSSSVSWRSTHSSYVLSSSCEAEIYAGAMAAQELRWLTYLLTDLGEAHCSPPVLYVDNKAILALCQEHKLEHRTKHIALRYFLARELQQHGQLRLAYVASQANTTDALYLLCLTY
ncbi:unnamed protein product, partial [Closterium sp. NIES-53]